MTIPSCRVTVCHIVGCAIIAWTGANESLAAEPTTTYEIAPGPYAPNWNSLKQYQCPDWFRDAKFGIWAHYGPQCEPEQGDWYARNMYIPGERRYEHHLKTYGHPSQVGFKDVCHEWRNERWNPDRLMHLYKRAGPRYFVAMANHHCNFDLWESRHQPWNSVNIGPKQDIVGTWAESARTHGLRFGVSVHNARSWDWYEVAHRSDPAGPLKGVPYDGALTKADGAGTWWDGFDPADLYGPHGADRTPKARQNYIANWFHRTKDLIDSHRPDLLYFDDTDLPLGSAGMHIGAHFYNANLEWHRGDMQAVLNSKRAPPGCRGAIVLDLERRTRAALDPYVWQTDTCIGNWHYQRDIDWYRNPTDVIRELIDVVSKNGNLLLSIPIRGDGTLDDREEAFLEHMADWMEVNGECLFDTRPWHVYGEGAVRDNTGAVLYDSLDDVPLAEIRFTTKKGILYAMGFDWPTDGKLWIRSLAKPVKGPAGTIERIGLLGHDGPLEWQRTDRALVVTLPKQPTSRHAFALEITGADLVAVPLPLDTSIKPSADGQLVLGANRAMASGYSPSYRRRDRDDSIGSFGTWTDSCDSVSWQIDVPADAEYDVRISYGCQTNCAGSLFQLRVGDTAMDGKVRGTGSWQDFITEDMGVVRLPRGRATVSVVPKVERWNSIELQAVTLDLLPGGPPK